MKYMLDTNICIYIIKKHPASVLKKLTATSPENVFLSSITLAELKYGVEKSQHQHKNHEALNEFLIPFNIALFDELAASHYGEIRTALEKNDKSIGPLDMLIAAHARSMSLTLVTNNKKEFERVPSLKIVDWV